MRIQLFHNNFHNECFLNKIFQFHQQALIACGVVHLTGHFFLCYFAQILVAFQGTIFLIHSYRRVALVITQIIKYNYCVYFT